MSTEKIKQVAIVTGASRGIGKSIAKKLASDGFLIALIARDETALATVQEEIEGDGGIARRAHLGRERRGGGGNHDAPALADR